MKPMLAVNIEAGAIALPVLASVKLDGIRGLIVDGQLRSRSMKAIPNAYISRILSDPRLNGLDGEIIIGSPTAKDVCRVTTGGCAREAGEPSFVFYVFDDFTAMGGFEQRARKAQARVSGYNDLRLASAVVQFLPQQRITTQAELLAFETVALTNGYEGLILRDPHGAYKQGRSTANEGGMLKLKRFTDSEAVIISCVEEMENTNEKVTNELGRGQRSTAKAGLVGKGRLGALVVRDLYKAADVAVEFNIGAGFTADDRETLWKHRGSLAGKIVKYKSFQIGVKDAPRFPVYLSGREAWDL